MQLITYPIIQGTLDHDHYDSSLGAQLFAARKQDPTDVCPVQNPDNDRARAAAVIVNHVFRSKDAKDYFEHGNHGTRADSRFSQRGMLPDGCTSVAKEIQRALELHNSLQQKAICSDDDFAVLSIHIENFFPTTKRQSTFDCLAGVASYDVPNTDIQIGASLQTPQEFQLCLPMAGLLLSRPISMYHYYAG
jgi:hypothetical protein